MAGDFRYCIKHRKTCRIDKDDLGRDFHFADGKGRTFLSFNEIPAEQFCFGPFTNSPLASLEGVMAVKQEIRYCIYHGYEECVFIDEDGSLFHNHIVSDDDAIECRGPFAECPPPPALTDEEWNIILDREYNYAS